jgi:ABC-type multidrug transport system fused ATPase/permease subunit
MCSFVGLLGESGVGKSTLVDCIARLREPTRGYIVFKSVSGKTIQPSIAYVPQKPFIANSDVLTNIALEKHVSKAKIAEIEVLFNFFFRELSEERTDRDLRLDSNLAQSLNSLSGGQTQRISIMRALLSQSDFIIFDECFSGLSEKMTRDIIAYLRVNYPKTTFLVISHSVSTLKNCDVIYRLEAKQLSRIEV